MNPKQSKYQAIALQAKASADSGLNNVQPDEKIMTEYNSGSSERTELGLLSALLFTSIIALVLATITYSVAYTQGSSGSTETEFTISDTPATMCQTNGTVLSILRVADEDDDLYYIGGSFTKARPAGTNEGDPQEVDRHSFVVCDVNTGAITDFAPIFSHSTDPTKVVIETIRVSPDSDGFYLFVGGRFHQVNGSEQKHVVAFYRQSGNVVSFWNPGLPSNVIDMTMTSDGNILYIAGGYGVEAHLTPAGLGPDIVVAASSGLTSHDPNSSSAPNANYTKIDAFQPAISYGAYSTVSALALSPDEGTLYLGGSRITSVNGVTRTAVAAIDVSISLTSTNTITTGVTTTAFDPIIEDTNDGFAQVTRILVHDGYVYLCGDWWTIEGQGEEDQNGRQHNFGRFDPLTGAADLSWLPWTDGGVRECAIEPETNSLVVGGHFVKAGGHEQPLNDVVRARGVAAFSLENAQMLDWRPDVGIPILPNSHFAEVYSVHAGGNSVAIGGEFLQVNLVDQQSVSYFELVEAPTGTPTEVPTEVATEVPTETLTAVSTETPTTVPTGTPTMVSTEAPTTVPTEAPTTVSTETPTTVPTETPTTVSTEVPGPTPSGFDCDNDGSSIPPEECRTLVTIYEEMGGTEWSKQDGWLITPSPCNWEGVVCGYGQRYVVSLYLGGNNLTGTIPAEISLLTKLSELSFSNNALSGMIPSGLGSLTSLTKLFLSRSNLSGEIPATIGQLSNLVVLDLGGNQLSGEIPSELARLSNLNNLYLYNNSLSGKIPPLLGTLPNLQRLSLGANQLDGGIPPTLGDLTNLITLSLRNNDLSGTIPTELGKLTKLEKLNLNATLLSGELPLEFGDLQSLIELQLIGTYSLDGTIPDSFIQLTALEILHYRDSNICEPMSGPIAAWLDDLSDHDSSGEPCPEPTADPQATPESATTPTPIPDGDLYENDNECGRATSVEYGQIYEHDFHATEDSDWIQFAAEAGKSYRIEAFVSGDSVAKPTLDLHDACETDLLESWYGSFSPEIHYEFTAAQTSMHFVKFSNIDAIDAEKKYDYRLSVQALNEENAEYAGVAIIVAGRLRGEDSLQTNIHKVTDSAYQLFMQGGYGAEDIYYLATDETLPGYDANASLESLEYAITDWAVNRLDAGQTLTLYMVDHGEVDNFYIDELSKERLSPGQLHFWLSQVEEQVENVQINVIIEACHAGSFIHGEQTISKPGRVIITSSNAEADAYASRDGASFSDQFITALRRGHNLYLGWFESKESVRQQHKRQVPWIDADGDGVANSEHDTAIASSRQIIIPSQNLRPNLPPYVARAHAVAAQGTNQLQQLNVNVTDQEGDVESVWARIYPPSYVPPTSDNELVNEGQDSIVLVSQGDGLYSVDLPAFEEDGEHQIIVHAKDSEGFYARPLAIKIDVADGNVATTTPTLTSTPTPVPTSTPVVPTGTPQAEMNIFIPLVSR